MPVPAAPTMPRSARLNGRNRGTSRSLISSFAGRGLLLKVVGFLAILLAFYQTLWVYWLAGVNIPDVEIDKLTGQKRIRRRPDKLRKRDHIARKDVPTYVVTSLLEFFLSSSDSLTSIFCLLQRFLRWHYGGFSHVGEH
jgi:hypothetical protein